MYSSAFSRGTDRLTSYTSVPALYVCTWVLAAGVESEDCDIDMLNEDQGRGGGRMSPKNDLTGGVGSGEGRWKGL